MQRFLVAFFILLLISALLPSHKNFAQDVTPTTTLTPTPTVSKDISYDLPYPGILPDNPLYFLKVIRDNLMGIFITDPLKKADYDLLMADKRLVSAKSLIDEKKNDLAITTLSKSGNYFDEAIQQVSAAKQQGEETSPLLSKMITASQKHQQIILQMEQLVKGSTRYNLELLFVRTKNFQDTVAVIKSD